MRKRCGAACTRNGLMQWRNLCDDRCGGMAFWGREERGRVVKSLDLIEKEILLVGWYQFRVWGHCFSCHSTCSRPKARYLRHLFLHTTSTSISSHWHIKVSLSCTEQRLSTHLHSIATMSSLLSPPSLALTATQVTKKPTSFLTLPSELRQQIILQSYNTIDSKDTIWDCLLRRLRCDKCDHDRGIESWGQVIRAVDAGIVDDMMYAESKWREEHEVWMKTCRWGALIS